jgi:hypothetical protein
MQEPIKKKERKAVVFESDVDTLEIFEKYAKKYNETRSSWLRKSMEIFNEQCKEWETSKPTTD